MRMRLRQGGLKDVWSQALSALVLPVSPWTGEALLRAYVEQVRGNELVLSRESFMASPEGPSGAWIPLDSLKTDIVWAHPAATGVQLDHVLRHELGHMVNGDVPEKRNLRDAVRLLQLSHTSGLARAALGGWRCRADSTSTDKREQKAEDFGYFTERWVARHSPRGATLLVSNMRQSLEP
jgi:hypothetical protein